MLEVLADFDRDLFLKINALHNEALDVVMYLVSEKYTWVPLYLFLLYKIVRRYWTRSVLIISLIAPLVGAVDQFSATIVKPAVQRLRPCHEPALRGKVHTVKGKCGGQFGFPSNHAANTFALAAYLSFFFRGNPSLRYGLMLWAFLNAYSRVYLGVHYPGDVFLGATIGIVVGQLFYRFYRTVRRWGFLA